MSVPIILLCGNAGCGKNSSANLLSEHLGADQLALADPMKRFARDVFGFTAESLWGPSEMREPVQKVDLLTRAAVVAYLHEFIVGECHYAGDLDDANEAFNHWYGDQVRESVNKGGLSPRTVLRTFGTEFGREVLGADVWVNVGLRAARKLLGGGHTYRPEFGLNPSKAGPEPFVCITDGRFANEITEVRSGGGIAIKLVGRQTGGSKTTNHASERELDTIPNHFYDAIVHNTGTMKQLQDQLMMVVRDNFTPSVSYPNPMFES